MRTLTIGVIALSGAMMSVSLAAVLPDQTTGAGYGVPSLVGEVTIRTAAGRESYVFKQGERIHFELTVGISHQTGRSFRSILTVRNLESEPVKVVYASGAMSSFGLRVRLCFFDIKAFSPSLPTMSRNKQINKA